MRIDKYIRPDARQRASKGEIIFNSLMPNRSYWSTWGWNNRLEQVQHLTNWIYVACDTICSLLGQHLPNMAYVDDTSDEHLSRGQRRKLYSTDHKGNYIYEFRQQLAQPRGNGGLVLGNGSDGWDGAALVSKQRHAVSQYPGYAAYKAISNAQPHEQLDPLSSTHPLRRLIVNPNKYDTSYDLEYELCLFLLLCGVSYLWAVPNGYGVPCELWVIPAHWVWPRGTGGQAVDPEYQHLVDYYEVRPFGAVGGGFGLVRIPADEVIAFTMKSPLSKLDGWSKLTAASQWIDTSESMDRSAWAQMQNQGMPSMFIELGEAYKDADDNQTARIEAKFAQKLGGEYNTGRPFVGKPGMKMTPLNWSPESMMYPTMGDSYRDKVLSIFHLSKVAIGMMDNMTYGSILAALAHTWIHCLNPLTGMIGQKMSKDLAPRFASQEYRKWLKEGGVWLDSEGNPAGSLSYYPSGGDVLFRGGRGNFGGTYAKSGYVRDPSGKRRISTDREEEDGREIRMWWPDGSPPDPAQVNSDIQLDFQCAAITTNEIRAIRGRPPYGLGGDNPLVQGPGGLMPLSLNVEEDVEGLGELVGAFTAAASGQGEEEQGQEGEQDGAVAEDDGSVGNAATGDLVGGAGQVGDGEPTLEELSGNLDRGVEEPNSKPSKGIRWVRRKEECTPGHTAVRDGCTPASGRGGSGRSEETVDVPDHPSEVYDFSPIGAEGPLGSRTVIDPQFINPEEAAKVIGRVQQNIPEHMLKRGGVERIELFDNPEDASARAKEILGEDVGDDEIARGFLDRRSGLLVASVYSPQDEGATARNFYHEFAHSLEDEINSEEWQEAYSDWGDDPDEGFAEAFSEFMVAKQGGQLKKFAEEHPETYQLFDQWNMLGKRSKSFSTKKGWHNRINGRIEEEQNGASPGSNGVKAHTPVNAFQRHLVKQRTDGLVSPEVLTGPVAAGLAVVADDTGRVLLLQRQMDEEDPNAGKWEFPGGRRDEDEKPLEAAVREWCEEVGHHLPPGKLEGGWVSGNGKYAGFVYRVASEDVIDHSARRVDADPSSGGWAAVAWVSPEDMAHHNLRPALLGDLDEILEEV